MAKRELTAKSSPKLYRAYRRQLAKGYSKQTISKKLRGLGYDLSGFNQSATYRRASANRRIATKERSRYISRGFPVSFTAPTRRENQKTQYRYLGRVVLQYFDAEGDLILEREYFTEIHRDERLDIFWIREEFTQIGEHIGYSTVTTQEGSYVKAASFVVKDVYLDDVETK